MKLRLEIMVAIGAATVGAFLLYQNYSAAQAARDALAGGEIPGGEIQPHKNMPRIDIDPSGILGSAWEFISNPNTSAVWEGNPPAKDYMPLNSGQL
jgi:hypothetical protein